MEIFRFHLYGYNPSHLKIYQAGRIKLLNPRVVKRYLDYLYNEIHSHDLFYRMNKVHRSATFPLSQNLIEEYESIDKLLCNLIDAIEA